MSVAGGVRPLLAICVPTYRRRHHLQGLLACLDREIVGHEHEVRVLVSDNASGDGTAELLADARASRPWLSVHRQTENVGAPRNIRWLMTHAPDCEYVWTFGDDDLIVEGGLATVLDLLAERRPRWLFLPHRWNVEGDQRGKVSPEPGVVEEHATGADLWKRYDHWLTFATASILQREALHDAARDLWSDNMYQPLLWFFAAGLPGPCVVAPRCVVHGGVEISWDDQSQEILTEHFTGLYDAGLNAGLSAAEFGVTLDGLYRRDHDMLHLWRQQPLPQLMERVCRFPHSVALRSYLWTLILETRRADLVPVVQAAVQEAGADAEARALVARGEQVFAAGDLSEANRCFTDATAADPTLAAAWNNLAVVHHALGSPRSALGCVERALFVAPGDADALDNRAALTAAA
jgi:hypothetical protein